MFYIRKPYQVEAMQCLADNCDEIEQWSGWFTPMYQTTPGHNVHGLGDSSETGKWKLKFYSVNTYGLTTTAEFGDWVVRDESGRFWIFTDKEFKEKFEVA